MTRRRRDAGGMSRRQDERAEAATARPPMAWQEPATALDFTRLARLLFDEADTALGGEGAGSILDASLAMLTSWRFRVEVAEAALDGALSPDDEPMAPDLDAWIAEVFGAAGPAGATRLVKLAQLV